MNKDYSIVPSVEHCACLVDLLGRAGLLTDAYKFIEQMRPMQVCGGAANC
ncbi:hypothetical protein MKW94_028160 [Papaver nudicaule]|uniref:Pentatricopeptide repeat-containing protein n=1 Tax=Papaver nudicaule TaxID=74823 RepID=A0AA41VAK3_PAPNU|nr:hypothetical protein [Papaver nudicaule]